MSCCRLQETCVKAEDLLGKASQLYAPPGSAAALPAAAGAGASDLGLGPGAAQAGGRHADRLQGVDLLVRTLKFYCSNL